MTAISTGGARAGTGRYARRAVLRWAVRLFRREWRQQLLSLALLVVAVGATVVGLGVVHNLSPGNVAVFGTASSRIDIGRTAGPEQLGADIAAARRSFGAVEVITHRDVAVPGSIASVDLRGQAVDGRFSAPTLRLVQGRYPNRSGEVAVSAAAAVAFDLHSGSTWSAARRVWQVVGQVENPADLTEPFVLAGPDDVPAPSRATLLLDATSGQLSAFRAPAGGSVAVASTDVNDPATQRAQSMLVLVLATIGLLFVALLSVAGFTVMAQRRLRALGMIAAIGATDRQVRLVLLANGVAVGVAGAALGTVVGLGAWLALVPVVENGTGRRVAAFDLPWWAVAVGGLLAIGTTVLAAWWPARVAARTPIVTALSGRPTPPRPARRFALLGVALLGLGFLLLVLAGQQQQALTVFGIVTLVAGLLLLAPLGVRAAGAAGGHAPVAVRLALRDLARRQSRSGAAVAAISLAVGIAAAIAIDAQARAAQQPLTAGNLPADQVAVWLGGEHGQRPADPGRPVVATAATPAELAAMQRRVASVAATLQARSVLLLEAATNRHSSRPGATSGAFDASIVRASGSGVRLVTVPVLATPQLLAFYGVRLDAQVVTARPDVAGRQLLTDLAQRQLPTPTVRVDHRLPAYTSAPNTLIDPRYAASLGLAARPTGWLLDLPAAPTPVQLARARAAAAAAGLAIETRTGPDRSMARLRDDATVAGVLLALGVLLMTVGLLRSESAGELRTLVATGASGWTRRTLTAATAGTLALLGAVIGTGGAYLALLAWSWRDPGYLSSAPVRALLALLVGLPVAAVVGGWLAAARGPSDLGRRPLD